MVRSAFFPLMLEEDIKISYHFCIIPNIFRNFAPHYERKDNNVHGQ